MSDRYKIGIVGAGIGGLTTAIALQQRGFNVVVYEQTAELREVGAGLTLNANADRILSSLGLGDKLDALGHGMLHIGTLDHKTGKQLAYETRNIEAYKALHGGVVRQIHRADMHSILAAAINRDNGALRLNHTLVSITQDTDNVVVNFDNGESDSCDIVIACDGLKSTVRDQLYPTQAPEFTGFVAWRGLVDRARIAHVTLDPHFASIPAEDKLFIRYPVRDNSLVNYVAIARKPGFQSESWSAGTDVAEVLAEFEGWHQDVRDIIQATPNGHCMRWALHTRQPLDSWLCGRVCLLGDAAHPMTPFYGMGAVMAIEDAIILARCFEKYADDWNSALKRYEHARLERAHAVQTQSFERGGAYMSKDSRSRAQAPDAGLSAGFETYDPLTLAI